jgi:hypothetical protein
MARSNNNDIKYNSMPLVGWGLSLDLTGKGHPIAKRVWDTKEHMLAYVSDANDSAVPGIILVVTSDTEENNGAYLVKAAVGVNGATEATVVKLATGETQTIQLTIADDSKELASIEDNQLHITDMRSRWETNF